ncbi:hypothetical protein QQS21_004391 [Conoideocrella luteorostrata]|uniref:Uncharacterized protein n=1 Tax=Conoideocrella luteorostrata TaxID=1105319 RepID=A0AAJ0CUH8_9HYPO|nr:hypothetical protein QQS21_004391 [Conoideocrella luteorostrata]
MKSSVLVYPATTLTIASSITSAKQVPLLAGVAMMSQDDNNSVPGHNSAVYAHVPKEEQAYVVESFEIAPDKMESYGDPNCVDAVVPRSILNCKSSDRVCFMYLIGHLPASKKTELGLPDGAFTNATMIVGASANFSDGTSEERRTATLPFKTMPVGDMAHLVIRGADGVQVDHLPSSGDSSALVDNVIPGIFIKTGTWHFDVDIRAGDEKNTCLFAAKMTTFLKGRNWP